MLKSAAAASTQTEINFSEITFREDLIGSTTPSAEDEIVSACDRELVISELAIWLQKQKVKIGNDTENELFTVNTSENRISHIFEVLTDTKENSLFAAAGKLLLQTSDAALRPHPVLVMPEDKISHYAEELQRNNISVIGFHWQEEKAVFSGLEKIKFR